MKTTISTLILALMVSVSFGQHIKYEKTFQEALAKASNQNKLLFFTINPPPMPSRVMYTGLYLPSVAEKYNQSFINYQINVTDTAAAKLRAKYSTNIFPAYFFIDKLGNIIYRNDKNSISADYYINMADEAIKQSKSGKTLTDYDLNYSSGKTDTDFLKEYITLRQKMGINDNTKLLEEYIQHLPISALDNYDDVLFILKSGPIIYSKAYTLAYTNRKIADSIYKKEPLADRSAMNGRMITNTYKEAVEKKNPALMQQLSTFLITSYKTDYRSGQKESARYWIYYYQAVKDTGSYLRQASYYYDNYYMNISADSAKKLITKQREAFIKNSNANKTISADSIKKLISAKSSVTKLTVSFRSSQQEVSTTLNNAAYSFYSTGTRNLNYILKAIIWSRRAIELNPVAGYYDTLAHLLYRYGFYSEAEADQNLAISMAQRDNRENEVKMYKEELTKIKKRLL